MFKTLHHKYLFWMTVIAGLSFQNVSYALVINFDDVFTNSTFAALPTSYKGFTWSSGFGVVSDTYYKDVYGNTYASPSGDGAAFNGAGVKTTTISNSSPFNFSGAYVTGWAENNLPFTNGQTSSELTFSGYRNGVLVGSLATKLPTNKYTWLSANIKNVDQVQVVSSGSGQWWLIDNVTINQPPAIDKPALYSTPVLNLAFPLSAATGNSYYLVTEAGGQTYDNSDGSYYDKFHKSGGYYSLDLGTESLANVVAAAKGYVVEVLETVMVDGKDYGPKVTVYHGNGYFTVYQEFTKGVSVKVGDYVNTGDVIGSYSRLDAGGSGTGPSGNNALHFQAKFNQNFTNPIAFGWDSLNSAIDDFKKDKSVNPSGYSPWSTSLGLSAKGMPLDSVTLGSRLLSQWQLNEVNSNPVKTYYNEFGYLVSKLGGEATQGPIQLTDWGTENATASGTKATLVEHSPAYLWDIVNIPTNATYLSFEMYWDQIGSGDMLRFWFGDLLLYQFLGADFVGADFVQVDPIWIGDLSGLTGQFLFELVSTGQVDSIFSVRNLQIFTSNSAEIPEPSSIALIALSLICLALVRKGRRI